MLINGSSVLQNIVSMKLELFAKRVVKNLLKVALRVYGPVKNNCNLMDITTVNTLWKNDTVSRLFYCAAIITQVLSYITS